MKKYLAGLISLLIILFCRTSFAEMTVSFSNQDGKQLLISDLVEMNNSFYLLSADSALYVIGMDNELQIFPFVLSSFEYAKPHVDISPAVSKAEVIRWIDQLIVDGSQLYALDTTSGALFSITLTDGEAILHMQCQLDLKFDDSSTDVSLIYKAIASNGTLAAIIDGTLYFYNMETGIRSDAKAFGVWDILPYGTEQLLLAIKKSYDESTVHIYDMNSSRLSQIATGTISKIDEIFYDQTNNRIVLYAENKMTALLADGTQMTVGYWPLQNRTVKIRAISDGRMLFFDGTTLYTRDISSEVPEQKILHVAANHLTFDEEAFAKQYPDVLFSRIVMGADEARETFIDHMAIASSQYDVFEMPIGQSLSSILNKKYSVPLDTIAEVDSFVQSLHPFIVDAMAYGDNVNALPVHIGNETLAYSQYVLEELGIDSSDVPQTYSEFLTFCLSFDAAYGDVARDKGITLFANDLFTISFILADQINAGYYQMICTNPEEAAAKEKELADIFALLKQLRNLKALDVYVGEPYEPAIRKGFNPPMRYQANSEPNYLFTVTGSVVPNCRHFVPRELLDDFIPTPLSLFTNTKPQLVLTGSALIINPYSENIASARTLIAYCAANFSEQKASSLLVDAAPVIERDYSMLQRIYSAEIERFNEQLHSSDDEAAKRDIQREIDMAETNLNALDTIKWAVQQEWIDDYKRTIAETEIVWLDKSPYEDSASRILWQLLQGFMEGENCAKEMVSLFEQIIRENR